MKQAPIIKNLVEHLNRRPYSAHTPGHKSGQIIPPILQDIWPREIWQYDLTEIDNMDNLHEPMGCIREAQELTAKLFDAQSSYFLVNGTSVGIQAAILALAYNNPIFVPRNVHKSVYNGLILANAQPIYLPVSYDKNLGFPLGIEPENLKKWINKYPQCKTIIITHPTYQGISYKIEEIMSIALANNLQIIVDEAHGSHLTFHKALPPGALSLGAHIVIQSWHKTLPVLTQASVLHIGRNYAGPPIGRFLNMLQTTSPSYLLLASIDACQAFLGGDDFNIQIQATLNKIEFFKKRISTLENIKAYPPKGNYSFDSFKLCLTSRKTSGHHLALLLRKRHGIYVELAEERYCLVLLGLISDECFVEKLIQALTDIDNYLDNFPPCPSMGGVEQTFIPQTKVQLREAFFGPKEKVDLNLALGRLAGDFIIKYPPGVPFLVPGEVIDERILAILQKGTAQFKIEDGIFVLKEEEEI